MAKKLCKADIKSIENLLRLKRNYKKFLNGEKILDKPMIIWYN